MRSTSQILRSFRISFNTNNIKVVALSILAATIFWFFSALNKEYSATIRYPIVIDYDRDSYVATGESPTNVQINVSGIGWTIFRSGYLFDAEPIFIKVDNPEKDRKIVGASMFSVLSEGLSNLDLNYVLDDTLFLNVDRIVEKRVIVLVDSLGIEIANNHYIVSPLTTNHDSVTMRGPRSFVEQHGDTVIVRIDESRINTSFDADVDIEIGNELTVLDENLLHVTFEVEKFVEVQIPIVLTKVNFPDDTLVVLRDSTLLVTYWIRESQKNIPEKNKFVIVVDYSRMVPYDSTIQPLILSYPFEIKRLTINSRRSKVIKLDQ